MRVVLFYVRYLLLLVVVCIEVGALFEGVNLFSNSKSSLGGGLSL